MGVVKVSQNAHVTKLHTWISSKVKNAKILPGIFVWCYKCMVYFYTEYKMVKSLVDPTIIPMVGARGGEKTNSWLNFVERRRVRNILNFKYFEQINK